MPYGIYKLKPEPRINFKLALNRQILFEDIFILSLDSEMSNFFDEQGRTRVFEEAYC